MVDVRGKTVVLTGAFASMKRSVAETSLKSLGAVVGSSVGRKTQVLFAGADAGSKLDAARALGVAVYDEAALLATIAGATATAAPSPAGHWFHAGFDAMVRELEAHPRAHIVSCVRGAPGDPSAVVAAFTKYMKHPPPADVLQFYTERDGCTLHWVDREDPEFSEALHARRDREYDVSSVSDVPAETVYAIAMPRVAKVFGRDSVMDYARREGTPPDAPLDRYTRSFIGFDYPSHWFTPAFVVDRGRVAVQMGDDHGVFDDGRPTVSFEQYLAGVLATRGSVPMRDRLFGLVMKTPGDRAAREDPRAYFQAHPMSLEDLLAPDRRERELLREAERGREEALQRLESQLPQGPRLRALVLAIEIAVTVSYEAEPDGRTRVQLARVDGGKQTAFLRPEERAAVEQALRARGTHRG